jgi:hypothetical protein
VAVLARNAVQLQVRRMTCARAVLLPGLGYELGRHATRTTGHDGQDAGDGCKDDGCGSEQRPQDAPPARHGPTP